MLVLDHDDFNFLSSSTICFLWWFIGEDIVLFFYVNFDSSVISLIKKVRNSNITGCSEGGWYKHGSACYALDYDLTVNMQLCNGEYMYPKKVIAATCHGKKPLIVGALASPPYSVLLKFGDENWKVIPDMSANFGDICLFKGRPYAVDKIIVYFMTQCICYSSLFTTDSVTNFYCNVRENLDTHCLDASSIQAVNDLSTI
ncbi:hypothetical protein MtrunA17_Chr8g0349911 [Medicago truncatula]|uniref:Uncharacterized protein n=1 Tax=Medicago truncatula TaxID=3880 RepID=A0A396GHB7_MEDTR|nr:hypothetical protein MtrunA17_Chr8g0349911 [Medicago truncatula]